MSGTSAAGAWKKAPFDHSFWALECEHLNLESGSGTSIYSDGYTRDLVMDSRIWGETGFVLALLSFVFDKDDGTTYSEEVAFRRDSHRVRIQKEVWDVDAHGPRPGEPRPRYWTEFQTRMIKEISDPAEVVPRSFPGLQVRSPERHLQWYDFQRDYESHAQSAKPNTASRSGRCDQEAYVEPRSEKDVGQCQEIDSAQDRVYARAWLEKQPSEKGI